MSFPNKPLVVHVKTPTRRLIPISVLSPLAIAEARALSSACAPVAVVGELRRGVTFYRRACVDLVAVLKDQDLLTSIFDCDDREVVDSDHGSLISYWRPLRQETKQYLMSHGHDLGSIPDEVFFRLHIAPASAYGYAMVNLTGPEHLVNQVNLGLASAGITVDNLYHVRKNGNAASLESEHQVFRLAGIDYLHPQSR